MRTLSEIAREIRREWRNIPPDALECLIPMYKLDSVNDCFYLESGKSIVPYFLSRASGWRGEAARRIKAELKSMVA